MAGRATRNRGTESCMYHPDDPDFAERVQRLFFECGSSPAVVSSEDEDDPPELPPSPRAQRLIPDHPDSSSDSSYHPTDHEISSDGGASSLSEDGNIAPPSLVSDSTEFRRDTHPPIDHPKEPQYYFGKKNKAHPVPFKWASSEPPRNQRTPSHNILRLGRLPGMSGEIRALGPTPAPADIWSLLITDQMVEGIVRHTLKQVVIKSTRILLRQRPPDFTLFIQNMSRSRYPDNVHDLIMMKDLEVLETVEMDRIAEALLESPMIGSQRLRHVVAMSIAEAAALPQKKTPIKKDFAWECVSALRALYSAHLKKHKSAKLRQFLDSLDYFLSHGVINAKHKKWMRAFSRYYCWASDQDGRKIEVRKIELDPSKPLPNKRPSPTEDELGPLDANRE